MTPAEIEFMAEVFRLWRAQSRNEVYFHYQLDQHLLSEAADQAQVYKDHLAVALREREAEVWEEAAAHMAEHEDYVMQNYYEGKAKAAREGNK